MEKYYDHIFSLIEDSIDFGFITAKTEAVRTIILDNTSEISILFDIESEKDFVFEPSNGVIPRKKQLEVKVKINPPFAKVIISNARITLDNKQSKIIKLSSISKYPYLRLQKTSLDFGVVQIGQSKEMEIIVMNCENVPSSFQISKESMQPGKNSEVFFILNLKDEVPPNSNYLVKILFRPNFPSVSSNETYVLKTLGGNQVTFTLSGFCSPINSHLGAKFVNFKSIELGTQMTKLVRIYNDSSMPTEYQIYHENSGAFTITKTQDVIPPKSNVRINITFKPYETMLYYDRVYCVIKNHIILSVDIYGSCHDLLTKSPLLEQKNIDFFRYKIIRGCFFDKKKLNMEMNNSDILDKLNANSNVKTLSNLPEEVNFDYNAQIQLHKEMFWDYTSENRIISFDVDHIDFNFIENGSISEPYILHVHNNSNETVKVKWIYDKPVAMSNLTKGFNIFNVESTIFFVQPEDEIINKKGTAEFKVYFKPNKPEYYFYADLPCLGTIIPSKFTDNQKFENCKNSVILKGINKDKLSETAKGLVGQSTELKEKSSSKSLVFKSGLFKSLSNNKKSVLFGAKINKADYFDPPVSIKISIVGHSFPPGSQIFMPMFELSPKKEIFFPAATIKQSLYQTLKISNKSDTPLFYKLSTDPSGIFRVHRKYGLIPANDFHLICIEFCPKEPTVYRFPLRIVFNHDSRNLKSVILNGLCTDPVIKLEGISNEIYLPPTFVGIQTCKSIEIKNLSPIKINVNIKVSKTEESFIEVVPSNFIMDKNTIKKIDLNVCPLQQCDVLSTMTVTAERIYDPINESIGIFNPGSSETLKMNHKFDKRTFCKRVTLIAKGSDGDISVQPDKLELGTVKVGFHKKSSFSIFNPSITNFYIKLVPEFEDKNEKENKNININDVLSLDFMEGLLNSFCQKEINITFKPITRIDLNVRINIYASDNTKGKYLKYIKDKNDNDDKQREKMVSDLNKEINIMNDLNLDDKNINNNYEINNMQINKSINISQELKSPKKGKILKNAEIPNLNNPVTSNCLQQNEQEQEHNDTLKCSILIQGKGDYPLIKIVDLRNTQRSISHLWKNFHVDEANEELQKKLTDEEIYYMSNANNAKKLNDLGDGLKCIKFDFGKHIYKRAKEGSSYIQREDVFLTLKNEGGVTSEFYFKFPDDIIIKREIWMDPIEPTSNDKVEYHVLKENIFEIEPRKSKLEPNECCNIRIRYNIKETGEHRLRVIFQIVNGKPLIFELMSETINEKTGMLDIPNPVLDFDYIPIGYMSYIAAPIELENISAVKIKFKVNEDQIKDFNDENGHFEIFKVKKGQTIINPGETNYITAYFRPLTDKFYKMELNIDYTDDKREGTKIITIQGRGYHPSKIKPPKSLSPYAGISSCPVFNNFNDEMIQKCGFSLEELDFGELIDEAKYKTLILYNYSMTNSFNFDLVEPEFLVDDKFEASPNKGELGPGKHQVIKISLTPGQQISKYEGDLKIKILWNSNVEPQINKNNLILSKKNLIMQSGNMMNMGQKKTIKTENLYIRIIKKSVLKDKHGQIESTYNPSQSFVEKILTDITREILCDKEFEKLLCNQMDSQCLGLFDWTSNMQYSSQEDARKEYLENIFNSMSSTSTYESGINMTKKSAFSSKHKISQGTLNSLKTQEKEESNKDKEEKMEMHFGEDEDYAIQDKYMQEMIDKYKLTIPELNEKLIVVNEDTRKIISDHIMEEAIYNIVSDAALGKTDLTEKPRIYFFVNNNNNNNNNNDNK